MEVRPRGQRVGTSPHPPRTESPREVRSQRAEGLDEDTCERARCHQTPMPNFDAEDPMTYPANAMSARTGLGETTSESVRAGPPAMEYSIAAKRAVTK